LSWGLFAIAYHREGDVTIKREAINGLATKTEAKVIKRLLRNSSAGG